MRITITTIIMLVCLVVRAADVPSGSFGDSKQPRTTITAMVNALGRPGESARSRIVAARAKVAGRDWQYLPDADVEQNNVVVEQVRKWGRSQK